MKYSTVMYFGYILQQGNKIISAADVQYFLCTYNIVSFDTFSVLPNVDQSNSSTEQTPSLY